jgi:uncharacterized membrane protein
MLAKVFKISQEAISKPWPHVSGGSAFHKLYLTLNQSIIYIHSKAQTSDHMSAGGLLGCKHASKIENKSNPWPYVSGGSTCLY